MSVVTQEHKNFLRKVLSSLTVGIKLDPRGIVTLSILTGKPVEEVSQVANEVYEAYQEVFRGL